MLGPMRSLKHLLLVVGVVPVMTACSLIGLKSSPTASEPNVPSSGSSASTVPTVSISLSLPSGASSSAPATTAAASTPTTDVRKVADAAAFATPSGRIVCIIADNSVRCDFISSDKAWTSPQPKGCDLAWGDSLYLTQTAGSTCHGDTLADTPSLDSDYVSWRRSGDPTVVVNGLKLAALPYGSAILVGTLQCDSATTGVTCRNTSTGHGFTMSREAYSIF
jgi:hypothetical protein